MRLATWTACAVLGFGSLTGWPAAAETAPAGDPRAEIAERLGIAAEDIRPSPVPGLYEVSSGTEIGYVSTDGRFYIDGDVFDMASRSNLTEDRRKTARAGLVKSIRDDRAIVFSPKGYVYTINVFTDIDCGYCRKLHAEIDELNRLGVRVRYLMYPRSGPGGEAWQKAVSVWCAADRNDALTRAKRGEPVQAKSCDNPVADQFELGQELGIRGTPGIITESGDYIAGYMPAPRLVEHLKSLAKGG